MSIKDNHIKGAKNLLYNCAELKPGETLLVISEQADLGWYDEKTADFIAEVAREMGTGVTKVDVGRPENVRCPDLAHMINNHDCTIFFSRIGDQDRFSYPKPGTRSVMCYIRDMDMLASPFGTTEYKAVQDLKNAVDDVLKEAHCIEITCTLGTNLISNTAHSKEAPDDVGVLRFPLGVPTPVEAKSFSGTLVMDRYLAPTGSRVYEPPCVKLDEPIFAVVDMGRIIDFSGPQGTVKTVKEHYARVSNEFNIDGEIIHSWHAGIHPGCDYRVAEADDPDRWSNTVFCHPEYVHFHTCGDYAPGEISCTLPGHTIKINGVTLWKDGKLLPHLFKNTRECLEKWPALRDLYGYSSISSSSSSLSSSSGMP